MRRIVLFFSSRRRHTRYWRDWSSDVCSSDLRRAGRGELLVELRRRGAAPLGGAARAGVLDVLALPGQRAERLLQPGGAGPRGRGPGGEAERRGGAHARSEERRVGKECRSRWS